MLGALAQTTVPLALGGEATGLAVLVHGVGDPVDAGVAADGLVLGAGASVLLLLCDDRAHCTPPAALLCRTPLTPTPIRPPSVSYQYPVWDMGRCGKKGEWI